MQPCVREHPPVGEDDRPVSAAGKCVGGDVRGCIDDTETTLGLVGQDHTVPDAGDIAGLSCRFEVTVGFDVEVIFKAHRHGCFHALQQKLLLTF